MAFIEPIACAGGGGSATAPCASASVATAGLCLADGTPIAVLVTSATHECGLPDPAPVVAGWINLLTGAFTAGNPPAGAQPCNDRDIELGDTLCDVLAGDVVGVALLEIIYDDDTGAVIGTRLIDPVTGATYVPQGVMQPCGSTGSVAEFVLCDDTLNDGTAIVTFVRKFIQAADGSVVSVVDLTLDGAPYTVLGTVGQCATPGNCGLVTVVQLCDEFSDTVGTLTATATYIPGAPTVASEFPALVPVDTPETVLTPFLFGGNVQLPAGIPDGPQHIREGEWSIGFTSDCDDPTGLVDVQVTFNAQNPGPDPGLLGTGAVWLFDGTTILDSGASPNNWPVGPVIPFVLTASVPAASLIAGTIHVGFAFEVSHGANDHPINLSNYAATLTPQTPLVNCTGSTINCFLRHLVYDCDGALTSTFDTDLLGAPYVTQGTVFVCDSCDPDLCANTTSLLLCDDQSASGGGPLVVTDTDPNGITTNPAWEAQPGAAPLWTGALQTWGPDNAEFGVGTNQHHRYAAAILQQPAPACAAPDDQVVIKIDIDVTNNGPSPQCSGGSYFRIYKTDGTFLAGQNLPTGFSAGASAHLSATALVSVADLAAGNIAAVANVETWQDSLLTGCTGPSPKSWDLSNFAAVTTFVTAADCTVSFLRHVTVDCDGTIISVVDTEIDGITPYVPSGTVGDCTPTTDEPCDREILTRCLCDDTDGDGVPDTTYTQVWAIDVCGGDTTPISLGTFDSEFVPYAPISPVDCGDDELHRAEFILCDSNGSFIRKYLQSDDGTVLATIDKTLAGADYVPVGTVHACDAPVDTTCPKQIEQRCLCDDTNADGNPDVTYRELWALDPCGVDAPALLGTFTDAYLPYVPVAPVECGDDSVHWAEHVLCDDNGGFLRKYLQDDAGTVLATVDLTLAGAAYTPVGTVIACGSDTGAITNDDECLQDDNGVFFRRTHTAADGTVTISTVDVAGAAYVPVGTVSACAELPCVNCESLVLCDGNGVTSPLGPVTGIGGGDLAGTLANGVEWSHDNATNPLAGFSSRIWRLNNTDEWDFSETVDVRFDVGLLGTAGPPGILQLPEGAIVVTLNPLHTYDPDTRILTAAPAAVLADLSAFRVEGVTEIPFVKVQGAGLTINVGNFDVTTAQTEFVRTVCRDCTGAVVSVTDTEMDAETPYVVVGSVNVCLPPAAADEECCDTVIEPPNPAIDSTIQRLAGAGAVVIAAGARSVTLTAVTGTIDVSIGGGPVAVVPAGVSLTWAVDQGGDTGEGLADAFTFTGAVGDDFIVTSTREI